MGAPVGLFLLAEVRYYLGYWTDASGSDNLLKFGLIGAVCWNDWVIALLLLITRQYSVLVKRK